MTDEDYDDLFRSAYPRLVAMGLAMSTERHVAQELAQETLLRAHRHRDELAAYDSPLAWCRRVMGNLLIDQHRKRTAERSAVERAQSRAETDPVHPSGSTDPELFAVSSRWSDLVASLSPQQRLAATLYYAEDQSVATIAETMEIATGTVKSALSKARRNLRRVVDGPLDDQTIGRDEEARS
ncbi:RNA polymerase sigma factor [Ilumatobacter sp.]|uniref:RNA polymerase sigma factor n=1 Tax=Ilumatobacter sp. TaxID=1967498 RepID=UPI003C69992F